MTVHITGLRKMNNMMQTVEKMNQQKLDTKGVVDRIVWAAL